jgi:predicted nucleic acid-binding protein
VPSEGVIITDSSPLIGLARIGLVKLLPQMARRVVVPQAVLAEVTGARAGAPGAAEVAAQPCRMGTVALLARAKREGLIPQLKPALDGLMANGIFIRQELADAALKEVGE